MIYVKLCEIIYLLFGLYLGEGVGYSVHVLSYVWINIKQNLNQGGPVLIFSFLYRSILASGLYAQGIFKRIDTI